MLLLHRFKCSQALLSFSWSCLGSSLLSLLLQSSFSFASSPSLQSLLLSALCNLFCFIAFFVLFFLVSSFPFKSLVSPHISSIFLFLPTHICCCRRWPRWWRWHSGRTSSAFWTQGMEALKRSQQRLVTLCILHPLFFTVFHRVAICYNVLQYVTMCYNMLQCFTLSFTVLQYVTI